MSFTLGPVARRRLERALDLLRCAEVAFMALLFTAAMVGVPASLADRNWARVTLQLCLVVACPWMAREAWSRTTWAQTIRPST